MQHRSRKTGRPKKELTMACQWKVSSIVFLFALIIVPHGWAQETSPPYDIQFMDRMGAHFREGMSMARQLINETQRPELRSLGFEMLKSQREGLAQMQQWRKEWYPQQSLTPSRSIDQVRRKPIADPTKPYEYHLIEDIIQHDREAVAMAKEAQEKAERSEIKALADEIIYAREDEITRMQDWKIRWYGKQQKGQTHETTR
jgi:uncharacterized protein (DUF305 family)